MTKLRIRYESLFKPTEHTRFEVEISNEQYKQLCERFPSAWYFVSPSRIKYFGHDEQWHYARP